VPGKKHGYAILKDVEELSGGKIRLSTGTLYSALGRLLDRGLIQRVPNDEGENTRPGLPRKAYILTENGRRVLEAETTRLQSLVAAAHVRLRKDPA
jgi:PadR family transcriptional regulator PadR